jgi:phospho-N-acetylmuramoyl-pentapeptide-transferase
LKKGLLDLVVAVAAAIFLYMGQGTHLWLPFMKEAVSLSPVLYVPGASLLLWFTMNATNCSTAWTASPARSRCSRCSRWRPL